MMEDNKSGVSIVVKGDVSGQIAVGPNNVQNQMVQIGNGAERLSEFDPDTAVYLTHIANGLQECYSMSEMRGMCLLLGFDWEQISNVNKMDMSYELVMYAQRRGKVTDLVQICQMQRPKFTWTAV